MTNFRLDTIPQGKQAQFYTAGMGAGSVVRVDFPAAPGRLRGSEKAGTTTTMRHVRMVHDSDPSTPIFDVDTGTSLDGPTMTHTTGRYLAEITAPGYDGTLGPCDITVIVDYNKN